MLDTAYLLDRLWDVATADPGPTALPQAFQLPPRRARRVDHCAAYDLALDGAALRLEVVGHRVSPGHLFFVEGVAFATDFYQTALIGVGEVLENRGLWLSPATRIAVKENDRPILPGSEGGDFDRGARVDGALLGWKAALDDVTPLDTLVPGWPAYIPLVPYAPDAYDTLAHPAAPLHFYQGTLRPRGAATSGLTYLSPVRRVLHEGGRLVIALELDALTGDLASFIGRTIHFRARVAGWEYPAVWEGRKASGVQGD